MADILKEARDNVTGCFKFYRDYREVAEDDNKFNNGDQWTDESKADRDGRPTEVVNDAKINIRRVKEDYKRRQSTVKITSVTNGSDKTLAQAFQGTINQIMRDSLGEYVMDAAFGDMLSCGSGYSYIDTEYADNMSHNQVITLNQLEEPQNVFFDYACKKLDKSDARYGGWLYVVPKDTFEETYPEGLMTGFPSQDGGLLNSENGIVLCRYYKATMKSTELMSVVDPFAEVVDGQAPKVLNFHIDTVKEEHPELLHYYEETNEDFDRENFRTWINNSGKILAQRDVEVRKIKWYILNNDQILDEGDWAGKYIPIIPQFGAKYILDGSVYYDSLNRESKDPARMYNYFISNMSEILAVQPVASYMGVAEKFEGYENIWDGSNNNPKVRLPYNKVDLGNGQYDTSPPIKMMSNDVPAGMLATAQVAEGDKQKTSGLHDSYSGGQGQEVSGEAIIARTDNSLSNVSVFFEARRFATILLGKVLVDLIPKIYDAPRMQQIIDADGSEKLAMINQEEHDQGDGEYKGKFLNFKGADFGVYVDVGPSYESQKKENQAIMLEMMRNTPPEYIPAVILDVYKNLDISNSDQIAENIKKLRPQILNVEEGEKTPDQLQAEVAQKDQQIQQLTAVNDEYKDIIDGQKVKSASDKEIAVIRTQADIQKEGIKQQGETQRTMQDNQTDLRQTKIESETDIQVELIKQMKAMSDKFDAVIKINQPQ